MLSLNHRNHLVNCISVGLLVSCLPGLAGCALWAHQDAAKSSELVTLELKGKVGEEDLTHYYSHSAINAFEQDQLIKERDEIVDFKVSEKVTKVDSAQKRMHVQVSTVSKDGVEDLHDLAFPEKGEEIDFVFGLQGQVWQAGEYPPDSVFFIPPLPLPDTPVRPGDTWTMDHAWVGMKNGVPLGVHMLAIFKNLVSCGPKDRCAEIELAGNVEVIGAEQSKMTFTSQIWGRLLFSLNRGAVVWSEVRSRELMQTPQGRMQVLSCMASQLEKPSGWTPKAQSKPFCKPGSDQVRSAPKI